MLALRPLTLADAPAVYGMLQGIASNDNGFHNAAQGMACEDFLDWLQREYALDQGVNLPAWMVPQTSYWLYAGDVPVGYGRLRHRLNQALEQSGGHIGYAIAAPYRGQGYGRAILTMLLQEAWALGLSQVQIGALQDNVPSNRIIVGHGGMLIRQEGTKNIYTISR